MFCFHKQNAFGEKWNGCPGSGRSPLFTIPGSFRLFTSLITTESHTELLFALANYLRAESLDTIRIPLGAALMQNECVARARAVASAFRGQPQLTRGEALRIGLLEPTDGTPLPSFSAGRQRMAE